MRAGQAGSPEAIIYARSRQNDILCLINLKISLFLPWLLIVSDAIEF